MCGIAGFFSRPDLGPTALERMIAALSHRGPDDSGTHLHAPTGTGLGHRRLAILDTSPLGHQPMTYAGSGLWCVFNGEIYNFVELRHELESRGHVFRSESDTEVVLAAWLAWGEDALRRFNGMWALALHDESDGSLTLARDRFGVKPLYYRQDGQGVIFASECKAFWAITGTIDQRWDRRGLRTAIEDPFQLESSGYTLLEGVRNLPPGHLLRATTSMLRVTRWWRTLDHLEPPPVRLEDQAERFREIFLDACRIRTRSDVPIGTSLSGGLDSSSVVATLAHLAKGQATHRAAACWRRAFVHSFPDTPLDEAGWAREIADASGVELEIVTADPVEIASDLDRILASFEGVHAGMPDSLWRLYRAQRRAGVTVTLDGHGADELLGGYGGHVTAALDEAPFLSPSFRSLLRTERALLGAAAPSRAAQLVGLLHRRAVRLAGAALGPLGLCGGHGHPFLSPDAQALRPYPGAVEETGGLCGLDRTLYLDFHQRVLPRILKNFDVTSMAHGVEVRMPFMDHRLVTYAFALPAGNKMGRGFTKLILREAMRGLLPEAVRLRRWKIGFHSPIQQWFRRELAPWIDAVLDGHGGEEGLLDMAALRACRRRIAEQRAGWDEVLRFWTCLNALQLTRVVKPGASPC